jgi:hypothetical protein
MPDQKIAWKRLFAEGVVIVASILLAFVIEAAWDNRNEEIRRTDLLEALHGDFVATRGILATTLEFGEDVLARAVGFLDATENPTDLTRDSLQTLSDGIFRGIGFTPATVNYRAAIAGGEIGLLKSDSMLVLLSMFDDGLRSYDLHRDLSGEMFYTGSIQDLRREFGGVSVFLRNIEQEIRNPLVRAAAEPVATVHSNTVESLRQMDVAAELIVAELVRLLEER